MNCKLVFRTAACVAALMPAVAMAQDAAARTTAAVADTEDAEIVVYGTGVVRQEQTLSARSIAILPPGSSPLKAVARLPGVALQSADPFGSYELGTRLSVRGFNQSQMGYTLDARSATCSTTAITGST